MSNYLNIVLKHGGLIDSKETLICFYSQRTGIHYKDKLKILTAFNTEDKEKIREMFLRLAEEIKKCLSKQYI